MRTKVFAVALGGMALLLTACTATTHRQKIDISPTGTATLLSDQSIRAGQVQSELERILEAKPVQGEGTFIANNKTAAIWGAQALALANLAEKVGELILYARTTAITTEEKDKLITTVKTESQHIIRGWDHAIPPQWDAGSKEAKVVVQMNVPQTVWEIVSKSGITEKSGKTEKKKE